jgi:hypothetical protein
MSNTIILDSYDYAEALKAANVPEAQIKAEVARDREHIKAINEIIDNNLATKHDIELIRKDLEHGISKLESRITTKLVAITVIIPTILKILEHFKI